VDDLKAFTPSKHNPSKNSNASVYMSKLRNGHPSETFHIGTTEFLMKGGVCLLIRSGKFNHK